MKNQKFSFMNIKDILGRDEMRMVKGGSGGVACGKCKIPNPVTGSYDNCYQGPTSCLCLWRGAGTGC